MASLRLYHGSGMRLISRVSLPALVTLSVCCDACPNGVVAVMASGSSCHCGVPATVPLRGRVNVPPDVVITSRSATAPSCSVGSVTVMSLPCPGSMVKGCATLLSMLKRPLATLTDVTSICLLPLLLSSTLRCATDVRNTRPKSTFAESTAACGTSWSPVMLALRVTVALGCMGSLLSMVRWFSSAPAYRLSPALAVITMSRLSPMPTTPDVLERPSTIDAAGATILTAVPVPKAVYRYDPSLNTFSLSVMTK